MLPLNTNGDPEYATVVMTVDRTHDDAGIHVDRSKMMSTRTPEDMLRGLGSYYGDGASLAECSGLIDKCAAIDVIYAYRPKKKPGVLKIVIGSGGYRALIDHAAFGGGSTFIADRHILSWISGVERAVGKRRLFALSIDDLLPDQAERSAA
jgi:hypothetical protein